MCERKPSEEDNTRYVLVFQFSMINKTNLRRWDSIFPRGTSFPYVEEVGPEVKDVSIEVDEKDLKVSVRVYDESAIRCGKPGDWEDAFDRCEQFLEEQGYRIHC